VPSLGAALCHQLVHNQSFAVQQRINLAQQLLLRSSPLISPRFPLPSPSIQLLAFFFILPRPCTSSVPTTTFHRISHEPLIITRLGPGGKTYGSESACAELDLKPRGGLPNGLMLLKREVLAVELASRD